MMAPVRWSTKGGEAPDCMTAEEWALWRSSERTKLTIRTTPCVDCPLGFAAEMRAVRTAEYPHGRCNGRPDYIPEDAEEADALDEEILYGARKYEQQAAAARAYRARQKERVSA